MLYIFIQSLKFVNGNIDLSIDIIKHLLYNMYCKEKPRASKRKEK